MYLEQATHNLITTITEYHSDTFPHTITRIQAEGIATLMINDLLTNQLGDSIDGLQLSEYLEEWRAS